jgi:hypothetical protein
MVSALNGAGGKITAVTAAMLISVAVVVLSATFVGGRLIEIQRANAAIAEDVETLSIDRTGKGDRLPVPATAQIRNEIKSVEVIGLSNASIVYRDRAGNILFQTDPLANVTIVTKNVDLPEVTIRDSEASKVERLPAEEAGPSNRPHGCESAFARPSPESLTRTSSRCVTHLAPTRNVAALQ